jgi:hypothetical protein
MMSGRLGLNYKVPFKNPPSLSYGAYSSASIDVLAKLGFLYPRVLLLIGF